MPYSILVVDQQPIAVERLARPLLSAGYRVTGATTFEAAREQLEASPPNLLIVGQRLGRFNGLHLVMRGRFDHPEMASIVTSGCKDSVLEAEAITCGARCVVAPKNSSELLELVSQTFASQPM
jgi:DNA-binding NtrC family response regulator